MYGSYLDPNLTKSTCQRYLWDNWGNLNTDWVSDIKKLKSLSIRNMSKILNRWNNMSGICFKILEWEKEGNEWNRNSRTLINVEA